MSLNLNDSVGIRWCCFITALFNSFGSYQVLTLPPFFLIQPCYSVGRWSFSIIPLTSTLFSTAFTLFTLLTGIRLTLCIEAANSLSQVPGRFVHPQAQAYVFSHQSYLTKATFCHNRVTSHRVPLNLASLRIIKADKLLAWLMGRILVFGVRATIDIVKS